jgi:hypothetical protein
MILLFLEELKKIIINYQQELTLAFVDSYRTKEFNISS